MERGDGFFPAGCFRLSRFSSPIPICSLGTSSFAHPVELLQEAKQEDLALGLSREGGVEKLALVCLSIAVTLRNWAMGHPPVTEQESNSSLFSAGKGCLCSAPAPPDAKPRGQAGGGLTDRLPSACGCLLFGDD